MPTFTVLEATRNGEPWSNDHGTFQTYRLKLEGQEKSAHLNQKVDTAPPQAGAVLDLELTPHPRFEDAMKAKKVFSAGGGGGGGGGARGPRDPGERRSIQMQHAQKCAVDVIRIAADLGEWRPKNDENALAAVQKIASKLFDQIEEAAAA